MSTESSSTSDAGTQNGEADAPSPFTVPAERTDFACPYCDRPFVDERQRTLHLGEVHGGTLADDEHERYAAAMDDERDDLWLYHFKAVVVLLAIYMLTGLLYLIALSG